MRVRLWLIAGLTTVALLFGAVGIAAAQVEEPADREPARLSWRAFGVVERVDGRTLVLATLVGPVSALTDDNTVFRVPGVEDSGVGDLAVGSYVRLAGWWDEGEAFHAFVVSKVGSDQIFPLVGKLLSTGDGTLTLDTVRGPATVIVPGDTVYRVLGVEDPGLSDLEEGVHITPGGRWGPMAPCPPTSWQRGQRFFPDGGWRAGRRRLATVGSDCERPAGVFRCISVNEPASAFLGSTIQPSLTSRRETWLQ